MSDDHIRMERNLMRIEVCRYIVAICCAVIVVASIGRLPGWW